MQAVIVTSASFIVEHDVVLGNLYMPSSSSTKLPAVVVAGPMTSVKEQVTGVYSRAMAEQGFAALTIDHRHYGQSDGQPRQYEYYPHKIEDLVAALTFLSEQAEVDTNNIGLLGICLGCGYASWASQRSDKVKWLGLIVGYYRDVEAMKTSDNQSFQQKIDQGVKARRHYEKTGEVITIPAAAMHGDAAMTSENLVDYYTHRANVANYKNGFALMSREHFLPFDVQSAAKNITVPTVMVHSENALSPNLARKFYENLESEKKLFWLTGNSQDDFYDNSHLVKQAVTFMIPQKN
ncbi:MAG: alpha/beta hydrolase [Paraglaciecola sp.]|nr:alpha/beta hydrolase [Paraglaciecola sp.]NCT46430.1 alpha/beta hydrolase [Paraglaciecola sp.]